LRARGIDVDSFLAEAHGIIDARVREERLAWMKVADEKKLRIKTSESQFDSWLKKSEESVRAAFAALLKTASHQYTLAFRNKTDLTAVDMARILDDHERLRLRDGGKEPDKT
jgi:hypothetical protein